MRLSIRTRRATDLPPMVLIAKSGYMATPRPHSPFNPIPAFRLEYLVADVSYNEARQMSSSQCKLIIAESRHHPSSIARAQIELRIMGAYSHR